MNHVPKAVEYLERDELIPAAYYISPECAEQENEKLWPRVWQMACRLEEIPAVGSFSTYDILNESIVIVRAGEERVNAFHNVCPHRGNRIANGYGQVSRLTCRFHGWQWGLDGDIQRVKEREDWAGCPGMTDADLGLKPVRVGLWGGFVFVNLDPECEPFQEFITPVPEHLDCLEFEKMSFIWYKTMNVSANWKTAIEAFMESYHVAITHAQTVPFMDSVSVSYAYGKHGRHGYPDARPLGAPSPLTGKPVPDDLREGYVRILEAFADQIGGAVVSERSRSTLRRLLELVPTNASIGEIQAAAFGLFRDAAVAEGTDIACPSPEEAEHLGVDWSVFPNMVLVFGLDCTLVFRSRPNGTDPNSCLLDMWGLLRQGPGMELPWKREFYEKWSEHREDIPYLLVQDLNNMETVQRGMHSSAFAGARMNPVQERQISNSHRHLAAYLGHPS
ncbi:MULTISPECIES: aromatic ring-hydroxylating oxygenase subunit alpha [Paraburkholderia]|uniref:Aromatic ring-hydroxylating dioxygenase subunit alpha n=1 Tax=Paraburkholderia guartelaensis TaxID=2546446 RepID=A0ABU9SDC2_9BURK|nr:aromatic ring-hydroxylating dioxygenase subunit alpha [Paraburkholderia nodosa]